MNLYLDLFPFFSRVMFFLPLKLASQMGRGETSLLLFEVVALFYSQKEARKLHYDNFRLHYFYVKEKVESIFEDNLTTSSILLGGLCSNLGLLHFLLSFLIYKLIQLLFLMLCMVGCCYFSHLLIDFTSQGFT